MKAEKVSGPATPGAAASPATSAATKITVPDMDCEVCPQKLVKKLTAVAGVAKVEANVKAQTRTITLKEKETPSHKVLWETCVAAGYDPAKLEGPGGVFTEKPKQ